MSFTGSGESLATRTRDAMSEAPARYLGYCIMDVEGRVRYFRGRMHKWYEMDKGISRYTVDRIPRIPCCPSHLGHGHKFPWTVSHVVRGKLTFPLHLQCLVQQCSESWQHVRSPVSYFEYSCHFL